MLTTASLCSKDTKEALTKELTKFLAPPFVFEFENSTLFMLKLHTTFGKNRSKPTPTKMPIMGGISPLLKLRKFDAQASSTSALPALLSNFRAETEVVEFWRNSSHLLCVIASVLYWFVNGTPVHTRLFCVITSVMTQLLVDE